MDKKHPIPDLVKVCDECYGEYKKQRTQSQDAHRRRSKKGRSETALIGSEIADKALIKVLRAQNDDLKLANHSLSSQLQILQQHNDKLKEKLVEKEEEIKRLLLKQLDSGALSGGLPSPTPDQEVHSNGLAISNGKKRKSPAAPPKVPAAPKRSDDSANRSSRPLPAPHIPKDKVNGLRSLYSRNGLSGLNTKKRVSPPRRSPDPPKRSSTFTLLNVDPVAGFEPSFGDLKQSTTEVIVDGEEYDDYTEDEEDYDDSPELEAENGANGAGGVLMTSTALSLISGNRKCASCNKDIVGRAVRAGDLVYHMKCHDSDKSWGFDAESQAYRLRNRR